MRRKEILKLMVGFKRFRETIFSKDGSVYTRLSSGQAPKTLIIGCSDSRVDPAIISSASPGDIFVVRNVANLVPPFESASTGLHGVSAAIEFAVESLKVENVIILGHRLCGGIQALMTDSHKENSFIGSWVNIAKDAKEKVKNEFPDADLDTLCRHCEKESIVTSIQNLKSFPFVKSAIESRDMQILGIYFDLELGQLLEYDDDSKKFLEITL